jgi:hypothetical protein
MTSVSKMTSKDVRGSDQKGRINLLESVLSQFPINIPSTECRKKPCKKMYNVLKTKQKNWNMLAVWKAWSASSYREMFQGIPHKNIILVECLHSIHYSENLKKSSVVYFL